MIMHNKLVQQIIQKKFTVTNLFMFSQLVAVVPDSRHKTDVVYTDFAKAFDWFDHDNLLLKIF